jgi:hypothetical protein
LNPVLFGLLPLHHTSVHHSGECMEAGITDNDTPQPVLKNRVAEMEILNQV